MSKFASKSRLAALVLAVGLVSAASAQTKTDPADNPADKEFIGAMRDMMMGMHQNMPTGDTDKDFVRMMMPHHEAAVAMAKTELKYGSDPTLKALAQEIITAQDKEIALMKDWESKHRN